MLIHFWSIACWLCLHQTIHTNHCAFIECPSHQLDRSIKLPSLRARISLAPKTPYTIDVLGLSSDLLHDDSGVISFHFTITLITSNWILQSPSISSNQILFVQPLFNQPLLSKLIFTQAKASLNLATLCFRLVTMHNRYSTRNLVCYRSLDWASRPICKSITAT